MLISKINTIFVDELLVLTVFPLGFNNNKSDIV